MRVCRLLASLLKGGSMIGVVVVAGVLCSAAPASAQMTQVSTSPCGAQAHLNPSTNSPGVMRFQADTTSGDGAGGPCELALVNGWMEAPWNCGGHHDPSTGICDNSNVGDPERIANAIVTVWREACGDTKGHSLHAFQYNSTAYQLGPEKEQQLYANCDLFIPPSCDQNGYDYDGNGDYYYCLSPIVIATGKGQRYKLSSAAEGVTFDVDADGTPEQVSWTLANDDVAFLAIDRNGNGAIDDGAELFGNHTLAGARNGFEALQNMNMALNGGVRSGRIDSTEPLYSKLLLWTDRNHNGVSEPSELRPFSDLFSAIIPAWTNANRKDGNGNQFRYEGWVFARSKSGQNKPESALDANARRRTVYDVYLVKQQ
jgi:hypothetical protein